MSTTHQSRIVLMGNCGAARIAPILHRLTGADVDVLDWSESRRARSLHADLIYVDLFGFDQIIAACLAAVTGKPMPPLPLAPLKTVVSELAGLPVIYRGVRRPSPCAFGLLDARPEFDAWFDALESVVVGQRVLDVQGLWARHGIPMDDIIGGLGHGEPLGGGDALGHGPDAAAKSMYYEARWVEAVWAAHSLPPIQCVALDVDLLIDGDLAADDFPDRNAAWSPLGTSPHLTDVHAWWHLNRGLHEALRIIDARGIALVLLSHNSSALVRRKLRRREPTGNGDQSSVSAVYADLVRTLPLDHRDFALIAGGTHEPASTKCLRAANDLGLDPTAMMYLSASSHRRREAITNAPELTVPDLDREHPRTVLLHGARLTPWTDARQPEAPQTPPSYQVAVHTETIIVRPVSPAELMRVEELLILCTTLNLTGQRPDLTTIDEIWVATSHRNNLQRGIVSAALIRAGVLVNWVCSCEVATDSLPKLTLRAFLDAHPGVRVRYEDTGTNGPARSLLCELGWNIDA